MTIDTAANDEAFPDLRTEQRPSRRPLLIGALLLLLIGLAAGGWAMNWFLDYQNGSGAKGPASGTQLAVAGAVAAPAPLIDRPAMMVAPVGSPDTLGLRVAELEQRLSRLNLEAASASGNASRAEGLLVAFAVRRALDRGLTLGYLDAQLRLRFGDDQPNAVKTIIETSREPVTLEELRSDLDTLEPQLVGSGSGGSLWTGLRREVSELFVVRTAGTASPRAADRIERARRFLVSGQVDKAIAEVQALPGAAAANGWLMDARRYHEARRALDLIETAAILEPRDAPASQPAGQPVVQPAPQGASAPAAAQPVAPAQ